MQKAASLIRPGITTAEIDAAIDRFFAEHGAIPLFKGVPGPVPFPASTCISVNEQVVHGIPARENWWKETLSASTRAAS